MNWNQFLSAKRFGSEERTSISTDARSQFQRDYDRIIFSSPFRRLQNKTQVFPLPGSVFVHNRLTHSLEVASVGRSLGSILANKIYDSKEADRADQNCLVGEIGTIVASACLAHDLGNPAFGHSGEKAISRFFKEGAGRSLQNEVSKEEWSDLIDFEGNANTLRILTHKFEGKGNSGYALTYSTLAALVKYPCESGLGKGTGEIHRKKYGFFQTEKETFNQIAAHLPFIQESAPPMIYKRHPLVYLVEAADDICYNIIDVEDAHRLHILSEAQTLALLLPLLKECVSAEKFARYEEVLKTFSDANDRIGFLRALVISQLIHHCSEVFWGNRKAIQEGNFPVSLLDALPKGLRDHLKAIESVSVNTIYNYPASVQIELAGYKVMGELLGEFVPAVLNPNGHFERKLLQLIPDQFKHKEESTYRKLQTVIDFVSGMTDLYAVEQYRKIKGIEFPDLR